MVDLVASRVAAIAHAHHLTPQETTIAIIGHGTPRHPRSRNATVELAARLQERGRYAEVLPAFLDQQPFVESIVDRASRENIIVVLFLIGAGPHATQDIPRRIGLNVPEVSALPLADRVGGRRVICDAPVGTDPGIVDIILQLSRPPRLASAGREATRGSQVFEAAAAGEVRS
jgi:sirohydrochlorin cobaltochelatase